MGTCKNCFWRDEIPCGCVNDSCNMIVVFVGDHNQVCASECLLYALIAILMDRNGGVGLNLTVHPCIHHYPSVGVSDLEDSISTLNDLVPRTCYGSA